MVRSRFILKNFIEVKNFFFFFNYYYYPDFFYIDFNDPDNFYLKPEDFFDIFFLNFLYFYKKDIYLNKIKKKVFFKKIILKFNYINFFSF